MRPIEQVISLGNDCQVESQLARRFPPRPKTVFDWIGTPLDAILPILEDAGARFGEPWAVFGDSLECVSYGTGHRHEFPETPDHRAMVDARASADARDKLVHKAQKTVALCRSGRPTLFVRRRGASEVPSDRLRKQTMVSDDLNRIADGIAALFPTLPFRLLFIGVPDLPRQAYDFSGPLSDRVMVRSMPNAPVWNGDDAAYDAVLDGLGLAYAAPATAA